MEGSHGPVIKCVWDEDEKNGSVSKASDWNWVEITEDEMDDYEYVRY